MSLGRLDDILPRLAVQLACKRQLHHIVVTLLPGHDHVVSETTQHNPHGESIPLIPETAPARLGLAGLMNLSWVSRLSYRITMHSKLLPPPNTQGWQIRTSCSETLPSMRLFWKLYSVHQDKIAYALPVSVNHQDMDGFQCPPVKTSDDRPLTIQTPKQHSSNNLDCSCCPVWTLRPQRGS